MMGMERGGGKVSSITSFNLFSPVPTPISGLIAGDSSMAKLPPAGTQIKQGI